MLYDESLNSEEGYRYGSNCPYVPSVNKKKQKGIVKVTSLRIFLLSEVGRPEKYSFLHPFRAAVSEKTGIEWPDLELV